MLTSQSTRKFKDVSIKNVAVVAEIRFQLYGLQPRQSFISLLAHDLWCNVSYNLSVQKGLHPKGGEGGGLLLFISYLSNILYVFCCFDALFRPPHKGSKDTCDFE